MSDERSSFRSLFSSIVWRIVVLVGICASFTSLVVWFGTRNGVSPLYTFPFAITASVLIAWAIGWNTVEPLRQATKAAAAMAAGDYSIRVAPQSNDEIGQLIDAFNQMASDLSEIDRMHREVVANVGHELRTPIAALRARLENMADGFEEVNEESLNAAVRHVDRLTQMVKYLLDLSRLESGSEGLDITTIALLPLIEEARDLSTLAAKERGTSINYQVSVVPQTLEVEGDRTRLGQVLVNLLENAARHSPPDGTVRISAYATRTEVLIDVSDQGPGVSRDDRERIFGRFQRGDTTPSTSGGTGIGLAISRWIASIHGGELTIVDSRQGATFRLILPAGRSARRDRMTIS